MSIKSKKTTLKRDVICTHDSGQTILGLFRWMHIMNEEKVKSNQ